MASLTGLREGTYHSLYLVDENGENSTEVRSLLGQAQSAVPQNPQTTDVLNISGLTQLLDL